MLKKGDLLTASVDFDNALFFAVALEVWHAGKYVNFGGCITKHTEEAVYFDYDDEHYSKQYYQFVVK
ncbi:MAG: hypothetical protein K0R57_2863 [Paenibacillaceae bacterium]|jgi:hypothetical protein|nr:hypothetical protein [Paenibacillaceae bacterium]